jgi:hypothetical protein
MAFDGYTEHQQMPESDRNRWVRRFYGLLGLFLLCSLVAIVQADSIQLQYFGGVAFMFAVFFGLAAVAIQYESARFNAGVLVPTLGITGYGLVAESGYLFAFGFCTAFLTGFWGLVHYFDLNAGPFLYEQTVTVDDEGMSVHRPGFMSDEFTVTPTHVDGDGDVFSAGHTEIDSYTVDVTQRGEKGVLARFSDKFTHHPYHDFLTPGIEEVVEIRGTKPDGGEALVCITADDPDALRSAIERILLQERTPQAAHEIA